MEKLLHERLRDWADEGLSSYDVGSKLGIAGQGMPPIWRSFADEIERSYIPRPRYEDGEPVQFGDEVELHYKAGGCEKGRIQAFHANRGPVWMLSFVGCDHERLYRWDSEADVLKRPAPKVYDADGVEIKVGDTVWSVYHNERFAVEDIHETDGVMFVHVHGDGDHRTCFKPHELTHKEPDSLEHLRDDMNRIVQPTEEAYGEFISRLTALIERGA